MYVAFPIRLVFRPNRAKHIAGDIDRFEKPINITGNCKAGFNEKSVKAMTFMLAEVNSFLEAMIKGTSVQRSDWTLVYSLNEGEDGLIWGGGGVVSEMNL